MILEVKLMVNRTILWPSFVLKAKESEAAKGSCGANSVDRCLGSCKRQQQHWNWTWGWDTASGAVSHPSDHSFVLPYNTFPIGCFSSFLPSLAFKAFICWGSVHLMPQKSFCFGLMTNSNCYGHLVFILKAIKRRWVKPQQPLIPHNHSFFLW